MYLALKSYLLFRNFVPLSRLLFLSTIKYNQPLKNMKIFKILDEIDKFAKGCSFLTLILIGLEKLQSYSMENLADTAIITSAAPPFSVSSLHEYNKSLCPSCLAVVLV